MPSAQLKSGDFSRLASDYSKYRPAYCESVLTAVLATVGRPLVAVDAVDVGAGTGIWTRMMARRGLRSVIAVEPNDAMRAAGQADSGNLSIEWRAGSGEATGLADASADLLSMASSFHWVDFGRGTTEFARVLRGGGRFVAVWNPRYIEASPLLTEIEAHLHSLRPDLKRVSSGRSGLTDTLTEKLWACGLFDDIVYVEGRHSSPLTPAQYLGAWRSVNDIQAQLGPDKFSEFLRFVEHKVRGLTTIETVYLTRAWAARRR